MPLSPEAAKSLMGSPKLFGKGNDYMNKPVFFHDLQFPEECP